MVPQQVGRDLMRWTASAPGIAMCQSVAVESHIRESRPWRRLPQLVWIEPHVLVVAGIGLQRRGRNLARHRDDLVHRRAQLPGCHRADGADARQCDGNPSFVAKPCGRPDARCSTGQRCRGHQDRQLATAEIVVAVAGALRENPQVPAVLDPVLASTSGRALLEAGAITAMKRNLMPLCRLVTPNLIELALLVGSALAVDENEVVRQGQSLLSAGSQALVIKGGHAAGPRSTDILLGRDPELIRYDAPRLATSVRGTGCMLASAIAAHLAKGCPLEDSVRKGKLFVFQNLQKNAAE